MPRDACAPKGMAWLLLLLIVLSFTTASGPLRANDRALEYRVKAEFLYNFARFVEWPEGSQDKDREAVVIGILGEDHFGPILETIIRGKNVGGKRVRVKRMEHLAEETGGCHLLFISRSQTRHLAEILRRVQGRSVLTVGDSEGSARRGTVISFLIEDETVQFEVNLQAAERAGIKISSRLLRSARIVAELP